MPAQQQGFDRFPTPAGAQFLVPQAVLDVEGRIEVGVRAVTADPAAKRLLIWSVGPVHIMTHAALLGGIGALDPDGGDARLAAFQVICLGMCARLEAYR